MERTIPPGHSSRLWSCLHWSYWLYRHRRPTDQYSSPRFISDARSGAPSLDKTPARTPDSYGAQLYRLRHTGVRHTLVSSPPRRRAVPSPCIRPFRPVTFPAPSAYPALQTAPSHTLLPARPSVNPRRTTTTPHLQTPPAPNSPSTPPP